MLMNCKTMQPYSFIFVDYFKKAHQCHKNSFRNIIHCTNVPMAENSVKQIEDSAIRTSKMKVSIGQKSVYNIYDIHCACCPWSIVYMHYPYNVRYSTSSFHFKQLFPDVDINRPRLWIHHDFDQYPNEALQDVCLVPNDYYETPATPDTKHYLQNYVSWIWLCTHTMCTSLALATKYRTTWNAYDHQFLEPQLTDVWKDR